MLIILAFLPQLWILIKILGQQKEPYLIVTQHDCKRMVMMTLAFASAEKLSDVI